MYGLSLLIHVKRWNWFEGMGEVRRRVVNIGFQEFSKLKEIKGKRRHIYEILIYALV